MAVESQEELKQKIASLEERIADTKERENYNEGELARMELDLKRLKNLKGDEGVHRAVDVEIPDSLTMSKPDMANTLMGASAKETDPSKVTDEKGDKLGKKGAKAEDEKKGAD